MHTYIYSWLQTKQTQSCASTAKATQQKNVMSFKIPNTKGILKMFRIDHRFL
jgi:hypothetical protein